MLNRPEAVVLAHDKLLTARLLRRAGLPHPRTVLIERHSPLPDLDFPAVVKPRFGSWGQDVRLCRDRGRAARRARRPRLPALVPRDRRRRAGADPAARPRPAPGRRGRPDRRRRQADRRRRASGARTSRSARASSRPTRRRWLSELALAAAKASGLDLVGVDLLPTGPGGFSVIELNGAVDFRPVYALGEGDVHAHAVAALAGADAEPAGRGRADLLKTALPADKEGDGACGEHLAAARRAARREGAGDRGRARACPHRAGRERPAAGRDPGRARLRLRARRWPSPWPSSTASSSHTERGFGTGLWAEIDRRHRAGQRARAEREDNVVKLEAVSRAARSRSSPTSSPTRSSTGSRPRTAACRTRSSACAASSRKLKLVETPEPADLAPAVRADAGALPAGRARRRSAGAGLDARARGRRLRRGQARRRAVPGRGSPLRVPPAGQLGARCSTGGWITITFCAIPR